MVNKLSLKSEPTFTLLPPLFLKRSCENDLIEGREGECRVKISDIGNKTLSVYHDSVNSEEIVMVAFKSSTVQMRCLGQTAQSITFVGPYKILLSSNCTLLTTEWRIDALRHYSSNVNVEFHKYIDLPSINFSWPNRLPNEFQIKLSPQTPLTLNWDQLPHLKKPNQWSFRVNAWWDSYGLITCILIGLLVVGVLFVMWRFRVLPTLLPCNKTRENHIQDGGPLENMVKRDSFVHSAPVNTNNAIEMKEIKLNPLDKIKYFNASEASFPPVINFVEPSVPSLQ